ncbi:hypothetical protein ACTHAM_002358 [Cellulomonas soli]|uniref:hypothetical protein n=1 Tax=Cellulomonas soli TaxID=931535 RepID=UPI003F8390CD
MLTRIPDVLDALVEVFATSTGLQVLDGPSLGAIMEAAICVGLSPDQSRPGYDTNVTRQDGLGRARYVEEWTVSSLLSVTSGDSAVPVLRRQAADALAQIDAALRAAPVRDGVWQRVAFGSRMEWLPLLHTDGATVSVFFDVVGASSL